jgi:hypothetical protein
MNTGWFALYSIPIFLMRRDSSRRGTARARIMMRTTVSRSKR